MSLRLYTCTPGMWAMVPTAATDNLLQRRGMLQAAGSCDASDHGVLLNPTFANTLEHAGPRP